MPSWLERFGHWCGRTAAPLVQRSVANPQLCTSTFSQCRDPVLGMITQDEATAGGVCESLSGHWIWYHAKGDSLWNWLTPNGPDQVAPGPLWAVMALQREGDRAPNQNAVTNQFLRERGILQMKSSADAFSSRGRRYGTGELRHAEGSSGFFSARTLAESIARDFTRAGGRSAGQYKKIGISGKAGAHAMAAWVAEDVCFFDPNFGEYWFPNAANFVTWFAGSFWYRSMYAAGLSGSFEIDCFAKAA
ncbi:YopT-type cysteine protease domain-containing protein [Belnapia sp. T6]|uniref:YopT-type cysteine protease domain-containing protein n=1 Tax=Belnapia mucosa TaxID=2804532 RepID=A0ABS1V0V4_9PROT|nr:YopT-type cysteine protease domain-containing protein [Belnapia mucosa]MBL6454716.1 YopT-type cysteine protease domain-containing protein [Belnapia mucosa]